MDRRHSAFFRFAGWAALAACVVSFAAPALAQRGKAADAPVRGDYRTQHFVLHTDLTQEEAKELLTRLETMLGYVSGYWGRPASGVIECFVVKDLANWPDGTLLPEGRANVAAGGGVTIAQSISDGERFKAKAVVYAVADHGTPQHEAVHAYCYQTFGTTGPVWYSEGMAEIGQYWREKELAVNADPRVIEYLRASRPKELTDIVDVNEITGDSWQAYAWRWALCYLLANNTNYQARFRPLGLALLAEQPVSFELTYGAMAREITFEYHFFLKHFDTGYRADLTSWDWSAEFRPLQRSGNPVSARIDADHGWQPSGLEVAAGNEYTYACTGTWKTSKAGRAVSADGEGNGSAKGKLVGIVMKDFQLGAPFELGSDGTFIAPGDGRMYLRCRDAWNELDDNSGRISVKLTATGKTGPIPVVSTPESPGDDVSQQDSGGEGRIPGVPSGKRPGRILKVN